MTKLCTSVINTLVINELAYSADFQQVLRDYRISDADTKLLQEVRLVILVGPSSSGRNTMISALLDTGKYHSIVSDTTRKPRVNDGKLEQNGVEYWFRTEKDFLDDLRKGRFLEAAVIHNQQVSGINMREIKHSASQGKIAIAEIEIVGMENIHRIKPDTFIFFVVPPTFEVWMTRMNDRGQMTVAEKKRRLESAVRELRTALEVDYCKYIVNDEFSQSVERVNHYVNGEKVDSNYQAKGRGVIEKLLADTQKYLHH